MYKAGSIYSYKTVWALKFGEKEEVFITISISSAAIVPIVSICQQANFAISCFSHKPVHFIWYFSYLCTVAHTIHLWNLSCFHICGYFIYKHLLSLFLDRSHQTCLSFWSFQRIFGFLNQSFFSIPLLLISTLSYYFNPSHFIGPENIRYEWYQFLEIWYWCSDL